MIDWTPVLVLKSCAMPLPQRSRVVRAAVVEGQAEFGLAAVALIGGDDGGVKASRRVKADPRPRCALFSQRFERRVRLLAVAEDECARPIQAVVLSGEVLQAEEARRLDQAAVAQQAEAGG